LGSSHRHAAALCSHQTDWAPVVRFDTIARREGLEGIADSLARGTASLR